MQLLRTSLIFTILTLIMTTTKLLFHIASIDIIAIYRNFELQSVTIYRGSLKHLYVLIACMLDLQQDFGLHIMMISSAFIERPI
jgi:hypothetical protein